VASTIVHHKILIDLKDELIEKYLSGELISNENEKFRLRNAILENISQLKSKVFHNINAF
jgi:hypothetical protein